MGGLHTPIVLIIFNRAELTARVFDAIRAARPTQLLIVADGPRPHAPADVEKCAATRAMTEGVNWPCDVARKYADENLGLRRNVSEGLTWAFQRVEQAIIVEDDCLPDPTFFRFCEELLERFADNEDIGMIAGTNHDPAATAPAEGQSYYFSRHCYIWGWATWRRAWQDHDDRMEAWMELRKATPWPADKLNGASARNFWRRHFDDCFDPRRDSLNTWDVPWTFSSWLHNRSSVVPRENLVTNLGCGVDAAHTGKHNRSAQLAIKPLTFPLQHPREKRINETADAYIQEHVFEGTTSWQRIYWKLRLPIPIRIMRRVIRWLSR